MIDMTGVPAKLGDRPCTRAPTTTDPLLAPSLSEKPLVPKIAVLRGGAIDGMVGRIASRGPPEEEERRLSQRWPEGEDRRDLPTRTRRPPGSTDHAHAR